MAWTSVFKPRFDELRNYDGELPSRNMGYRRVPTPEVQGYTDRYGRPVSPRPTNLVTEQRNVSPMFGVGPNSGIDASYVAGSIGQALMGRNAGFNGSPTSWMGGGGYASSLNLKLDYGTLIAVARRNEVIYRCVRLLQDSTVGPRLEVQNYVERPVPQIREVSVLEDRDFIVEKTSDWDVDKTHKLKRLMMKPNKMMSGKRLLALWITDLITFGKFFIYKERGQSGLPVNLYRLDPRNMEPKTIIDNEVTRWEYTEYDETGKAVRTKRYWAEDIIFDTMLDQNDPYLGGLSPMSVALGAGLADIGKTDFVRQFFDNDATPGGILTIENTIIDQAKADEIKMRWNQRFSRRAGGVKSIAVLDQNAKYAPVSSKLDELDSQFTTSQMECRLCMVFGVPPVLAFTYGGINRATYTNSDQSEKFFWSNTLMPMFDMLLDSLTWQLLTDFETEDSILDEKVRLQWNYEGVKALQEDVEAVHKRARDNVQAGIWMVSEARKLTNVPIDPYSDYYLRTEKLVPSYADVAAADAALLGKVPSVQVISTPGKDQGQTLPGIVDDAAQTGAAASLAEQARTIDTTNPQAQAVQNAVPGSKKTRPN